MVGADPCSRWSWPLSAPSWFTIWPATAARSFWRVVFTIPMVIPITVTLLIWQQVYSGRQGLLNEFLVGIGAVARPLPWLGRPDTALPALILVGFPAVAGFGFLIILAALQNLPSEVNDAALIDGCSRLRRVFAIDLPAIRGPLALIIILSMNSGMQEFAPMIHDDTVAVRSIPPCPRHTIFTRRASNTANMATPRLSGRC